MDRGLGCRVHRAAFSVVKPREWMDGHRQPPCHCPWPCLMTLGGPKGAAAGLLAHRPHQQRLPLSSGLAASLSDSQLREQLPVRTGFPFHPARRREPLRGAEIRIRVLTSKPERQRQLTDEPARGKRGVVEIHGAPPIELSRAQLHAGGQVPELEIDANLIAQAEVEA